jgi:predicted metal-binding transcription factor (methanogenesis marker protein 9)
MRVYGYKYPKSLKFMATVYKCLKDCYDKRYETLNIDMNYFLLLKNELSLAFLRKFDNVVATVRSAIKLYACKDEANRKEIEAGEIAALEKIIKSQIKAANQPTDA